VTDSLLPEGVIVKVVRTSRPAPRRETSVIVRIAAERSPQADQIRPIPGSPSCPSGTPSLSIRARQMRTSGVSFKTVTSRTAIRASAPLGSCEMVLIGPVATTRSSTTAMVAAVRWVADGGTGNCPTLLGKRYLIPGHDVVAWAPLRRFAR
jgi:hypothetical protein